MNITEKYKSALSLNRQKALSLITQLADDMDVKVYLVGGIVRDMILGRKFNDIDILIEYDATIFANLLQKKHGNLINILATNNNFRTVKLEFSINSEKFEADLASTRSEVYEYPSALPILAETCVPLKKDIMRRDFTINALTMSLNSKTFGEIFDETGMGTEDLENKIIRILHADSFMDDPSRIVRGLKYRSRLGFELSDNTKLIQDECLKSGKFDNDCQDRIKTEIIETLNFNDATVWDKFISEKIYKLIVSKISKTGLPSGVLINNIINTNLSKINTQNIWLILLLIVFNFAPEDLANNNIKKLNLTKKERKISQDFFALKKNIYKLSDTTENYEIFDFLKNFYNEAIVVLLCVCNDFTITDKINLYLNKLSNIKLSVNGNDIKKYGIDDGVIFGTILKSTLEIKMNKNLSNEEEKKYFNDICKSIKEQLK